MRIIDVLTEGILRERLKVNFVGFVGDKRKNTGEDRGYLIRTAKDLWPRYSLGKKGERYRIVALEGKSLLGEMSVMLHPPKLNYLVVKRPGDAPTCIMGGMQIAADPGDEIHIVDIKTNVPDNLGVRLEVEGDFASLKRKADEWVLRLSERPFPRKALLVTRYGIPMGRVWIQGP